MSPAFLSDTEFSPNGALLQEAAGGGSTCAGLKGYPARGRLLQMDLPMRKLHMTAATSTILREIPQQSVHPESPFAVALMLRTD
jgi:hypothetical protein